MKETSHQRYRRFSNDVTFERTQRKLTEYLTNMVEYIWDVHMNQKKNIIQKQQVRQVRTNYIHNSGLH